MLRVAGTAAVRSFLCQLTVVVPKTYVGAYEPLTMHYNYPIHNGSVLNSTQLALHGSSSEHRGFWLWASRLVLGDGIRWLSLQPLKA